jgi:cyanophycinase
VSLPVLPAFAWRWAFPGPLLASLVALVGCTGSPPEETDPSEGQLRTGAPLVIVGGGLASTNREVYQAILDGREGDGPICVIPTAGGSPESSMEQSVERIDEWGGAGTARGLFLTVDAPERAYDSGVASEIEECGGFFFTGGDQSRILDFFLPSGELTPAYLALMDRFTAGAGVSGSSAGAAMVSDPMIAGGTSEAAFRSGVTLGEGEEGVHIRQGMGFLRGTLIDQHFLARGRIGRLLVAVAELDDVDVGWGIDENTALVVRGNEAWVAGASGVILVDGSTAIRRPGPSFALDDVRIHLLGPGDRVDLRTLEVTPADGKAPVPGVSPPGSPSGEGAFERWAFLHALHGIARSPRNEMLIRAPEHLIRLRAAPGFQGVATGGDGVEGTPHGLSVGPVLATIEPVS